MLSNDLHILYSDKLDLTQIMSKIKSEGNLKT